MNRQQVRELLRLISSYDGREVTELAVGAWHENAIRCGWDEDTARDAVRLFYGDSEDAPILWGDGPVVGTPRPVLPYDINAFAALRRDVIQGEK